MSRWMEENFPKSYNPNSAPAVLMPLKNHNATRGVFNIWRAEMRKAMGGTFDWSKVTRGDIINLSERMFDAANVPAEIHIQYYDQLAEFFKTL
jgi:hypothetical protein